MEIGDSRHYQSPSLDMTRAGKTTIIISAGFVCLTWSHCQGLLEEQILYTSFMASLSFGICGEEEKKREKVEENCFNFIMVICFKSERRKER
jgi:hypothetical protein